MFLSLEAYAKQPIEKIPTSCEANPLFLGCPSAAPVNAIINIFNKDFPSLSVEKTKPSFSLEGYTALWTKDQQTYIRWTENNDRSLYQKISNAGHLRFLRMHQGIKGQSQCYYDYEISKHSLSNRMICNVSEAKRTDPKCATIIARDPLLQKKATCDEFIQAVLTCSKNNESMEKCRVTFMDRAKKIDEAQAKRTFPQSEKTTTSGANN